MSHYKSRGDGAEPPDLPKSAVASAFALADLAGARGPFTGTAIDHRLPCTASRSRTCRIVEHLDVWNEWLFTARLQLCEIPGTEGHLSITSLESASPIIPHADELKESPTLVHWLLTTHRCITAFDVTDTLARNNEALLCDALRRNTSIKALRILLASVKSYKQLCGTIAHLTHLEELEHAAREACPAFLLSSLSALLQSTKSLTDLRIPGLQMQGEDADTLLRALQGNYSLKALSLPSALISEASTACREEFAEFLKSRSKLAALNIFAMGLHSADCFTLVLDVLLTNKKLSEVSLTYFSLDQASARLISRVVEGNKVLSKFCLSLASVSRGLSSKNAFFNSWVAAFSENEALEELRLPLGMWEPDHWQQFFRSVSEHRKVKNIVIDVRSSDRCAFREVYEGLRQSGAAGKVSFKRCWISDAGAVDRFEYEAFAEAVLFYFNKPITVPIPNALKMLPRRSSVSTLILFMNSLLLDSTMSTALANFLRETAALKKLCLNLWPRESKSFTNGQLWSAIIDSLAENTSIAELDVCLGCLDEENGHCLADALKRSRNIRRGAFQLGEATAAFVSRLSLDIKENYTIVDVKLHCCRRTGDGQWFHVVDTARRNLGLVARASQFLSADHWNCADRRCAAAVEIVSGHRALVTELAAVMSLGETDMEAMVRDTVRSLENMHVFMRAAGIVRRRVVCHPRKDGRKQLDDLNEDCWKAVRRFLNFDDVRDELSCAY